MQNKILLSPREMKDVLVNPHGHDIEWPQAADKSLAMSFTKLSDFDTCPRMYAEKYIYKTVKYDANNPTLLWGNKVHDALEKYVLEGKPLPKDIKQFQSIPDAIMTKRDRLAEKGKLSLEIFGEQEWAIGLDGRKKSWFDSSGVFVRGKADVGLSSHNTLFLYDYKTGQGKHPKPEQIDLMAVVAAGQNLLTGQQKVNGMLLFIEARKQVPLEFGVHELTDRLREWQRKAFTILDCYQRDHFTTKTSGLCKKHCECFDCPENGRNHDGSMR